MRMCVKIGKKRKLREKKARGHRLQLHQDNLTKAKKIIADSKLGGKK